ncbi:uncharacterized protein L201_007329 [Kwoniella dendrophila CBS 6074]|uniref:Mediator of RNA polymerase II transcription subunit 8 n=1 Tax=Kwoniella dendrophila CBS 6074 TaxID=1295534 RepID=A0AAX4K435_9TREE
MQNQPRPNSGPSIEYQPPLAPSIPSSSINTLIPRLTTTINDIDSLRNLIGSGYNDGTLPSWDTLLQRYSLLLGRINALSNYLTPPPPPTSSLLSTSTSLPKQLNKSIPPPNLANYLIHPLNPLPTNPTSEGFNELSPFAQETFLQSIHTQLIDTSSSSSSIASGSIKNEGQNKWHTSEELRKLDERELITIKNRLNSRLQKEKLKIDVIKREINRREDEIDWNMRIGEDEDEDEEDDETTNDKEKNTGKGDNDEDDDDDLFGGDEDDDEPMIIDVDAEKPIQSQSQKKDPDQVKQPEKKEEITHSWTMEEYIKFMDSGTLPKQGQS